MSTLHQRDDCRHLRPLAGQVQRTE